MMICKLHNSCKHYKICKYASPVEKKSLQLNSVCYNLVNEKYYTKYIRNLKLKKLNERDSNIKI